MANEKQITLPEWAKRDLRSYLLYPEVDIVSNFGEIANTLTTLKTSGDLRSFGQLINEFPELERVDDSQRKIIQAVSELQGSRLIRMESPAIKIKKYKSDTERPEIILIPGRYQQERAGTYEKVLVCSLAKDFRHLEINYIDLFYHFPIVEIEDRPKFVGISDGVIVDDRDLNYISFVTAHTKIGGNLVPSQIESLIGNFVPDLTKVEFPNHTFSRG